MKIETKYNVGDKIFTIEDGKIVKVKVESIHCAINTLRINKYYISYQWLTWIDNSIYADEDVCFKTKEELIASL